ncbi:MAG TPA: glycosyltransferase family 4 protein [Conexibacter sp.]
MIRLAVVPPVPMPYREPLFAALARVEGIELRVVYQAAQQPGWDAPRGWFPESHDYAAEPLRAWQRTRPGRTPVVWPRGLERALSRYEPDAVVAWEYGPTSLRTLAWCRLHRRGYAIFSELTPQVVQSFSPRHVQLQRLIAGQAAAFVAASSRARDRFLALGAAPERVVVSVQSADTERLRGIERSGSNNAPSGVRDAQPVRFLAVGRLVPDKNLARLIDAFAAAGLGPDRARLTVHGIGPLRAELEARAARAGVDVRFAGHTSAEELPTSYADADVFVLASTFEPFGVVVREAGAAALPIVCTRVAGAAGDVAVEGENALLVDPLDVSDIAAALRRLADDPPLRATLGARGREIEQRVASDGVAAFARAAEIAAARRRR